MIGRRDFFCLSPLCFFPYSRLSSYHHRLSLCLISFSLFPCVSVWEPHVPKPIAILSYGLDHRTPCPIAVLNGFPFLAFIFSLGEMVCNLGRSFVYQNQIKLNQRVVGSACGPCFGPALDPPVHHGAFLSTRKQTVRLC